MSKNKCTETKRQWAYHVLGKVNEACAECMPNFPLHGLVKIKTFDNPRYPFVSDMLFSKIQQDVESWQGGFTEFIYNRELSKREIDALIEITKLHGYIRLNVLDDINSANTPMDGLVRFKVCEHKAIPVDRFQLKNYERTVSMDKDMLYTVFVYNRALTNDELEKFELLSVRSC